MARLRGLNHALLYFSPSLTWAVFADKKESQGRWGLCIPRAGPDCHWADLGLQVDPATSRLHQEFRNPGGPLITSWLSGGVSHTLCMPGLHANHSKLVLIKFSSVCFFCVLSNRVTLTKLCQVLPSKIHIKPGFVNTLDGDSSSGPTTHLQWAPTMETETKWGMPEFCLDVRSE